MVKQSAAAAPTRSTPSAGERKLASPTAHWRKRERYVIEITFANDNEPRDIFVGGMEEGDMRITRGKPVLVPPSVLTRLDDAIMGVAQQDDEDPEKVIVVDRKRFPYTVLQYVAAGAPDPDLKSFNLGRRELPSMRVSERSVDPAEAEA